MNSRWKEKAWHVLEESYTYAFFFFVAYWGSFLIIALGWYAYELIWHHQLLDNEADTLTAFLWSVPLAFVLWPLIIRWGHQPLTPMEVTGQFSGRNNIRSDWEFDDDIKKTPKCPVYFKSSSPIN